MRYSTLPGSGTGTEGIVILPGILFERNPRILVTTFWGDPVAAPKSDPPNFVNNVDEDDSPVLAELSSCDATVLSSFLLKKKKIVLCNHELIFRPRWRFLS